MYTPDPVINNTSSENNETEKDQTVIKENQLLKDQTIVDSQYSYKEEDEFVQKSKTIVISGNPDTLKASEEMYAVDVKPAKIAQPSPVKATEKQKTETTSNTENSNTAKEKIAETKTKAQQSGFRKSEASKYKNLEEAYMETEALIKKLQKDSSSDLASRIKGDSRNSSTRVSNNGQYDNFLNDPESDTSVQAALFEKFGTEPSYFIDGVQVEKKDFLRLRDKDIVSRTIKTKDTITANPNGEIWIETKKDNR